MVRRRGSAGTDGASTARSSASHQNSPSRPMARETRNIVAGTPARSSRGRIVRGEIGIAVVEGRDDGPGRDLAIVHGREQAGGGRRARVACEDVEVLVEVVRCDGQPPRIGVDHGRAVVHEDQGTAPSRRRQRARTNRRRRALTASRP